MITLPLRSERVPRVRVLIADQFNNKYDGSASAGKGPWTELPMLTDSRAGFELLDGLSRAALPEIGECKLRMRFGVIDGRIIGVSASAMANIQATGSWDADTDTIEVPSLMGKEIRVQMAEDTPSFPAWRTVWWGSCEYESDSEWPAGLVPVGERICHCFDGLFRTKRWFMTRHAAYIDSTRYEGSPGHPGYNVGLGGKTLGNREITGAVWSPYPDSDTKLLMHAWQGTAGATTWTDQQAVEHALRVSRPEGQPQFSFAGSTTLLSTGASPWPVDEGESAYAVLIRICARERGRGLVYVDWDDDLADPTGPLAVKLSVKPQTYNAITYISNPTTGATSTIPGALAEGTAVSVDLTGDHRVVDQGFDRSVRGIARYDAVETVAERIQVLITASRKDGTDVSLENRWSATDATDFLALDFEERIDEKWRQVYQAYGLPRTWQGMAKDHDAGAEYAAHRVDYRCNDDGAIIVPSGTVETSPLLVTILPDTPLLEGYTYSGATPARRDAGTETGMPDRRPPTVWLRTAANRYEPGNDLTLHIKRDSIMVTKGEDDQSGARFISDTSLDLGAAYDTSALGITLALELPHRLRFKSLSPALPTGLGVRHVKRIEVPDAHLWLASPGAIWDIDGSTLNENGCTAQRGACGATLLAPGVLRDDRARVAVLHALACAWYLFEHRPASWTMRCCGLLPDFGVTTNGSPEIDENARVAYPQLGQLLITLTANGQVTLNNAPITGKIYNHQAQTSTWSCDWTDLDVRRA